MSSKPISVVYRDRGWAFPVLLVGGLLLAWIGWSERVHAVHCSRKTGSCVIEEPSATRTGRTKRRQLPIDAIVAVTLYKVNIDGRRARQGLELWTLADDLRLEATEPCAVGSIPCPGEQTDAQAALQAFLKDPKQPEVDVDYGSNAAQLELYGALLFVTTLGTLLFRSRVRVTVLAARRQVVVVTRLGPFRIARNELGLDGTRNAALSSERSGLKTLYGVDLIREFGSLPLLLRPSTGAAAKQRFVDQLNAAFESARAKAGPVPATPPPERNLAPVAASRSRWLSDDPIVVVGGYRGFARFALAIGAVLNLLVVPQLEREEMHCARATQTCTLERYSLWGEKSHRTVPMGEVTQVAEYQGNAEGPGAAMQGVELLTHSAPIALRVSDSCASPERGGGCSGEALPVYLAVSDFFDHEARARLDIAYGSTWSTLFGLEFWLALLVIVALLPRQSFRVLISPGGESVEVIRRRALIFRRRFYFDLLQVEGASLDERRAAELSPGTFRPALTTRRGDQVWFSWGWSAWPHRLHPFVAEINAALAVARTRINEAHARREPSGAPPAA